MQRSVGIPGNKIGFRSTTIVFAVIGALLLLPAKGFTAQVTCDSYGNKMIVPYTVRRCLDQDNGLYISYTEYGPWTLYSPTGSVIEQYDAITVQNQNDDICGLPDTPSTIGYAADGSGNYVSVTDYLQWKYVYDSNGNVLYGPFGACPS